MAESVQAPVVRSIEDWADVDLSGHVSLIFGWRRGKVLEARRLSVAAGLRKPLLSYAEESLSQIALSRPRMYEATAELEDDEVFCLTSSQLPKRASAPVADNFPPDEGEQASALFALLSRPGALKEMALDEAKGRAFLFYALVVTQPEGSPVAFVTKHNSAALLRGGFLLGQYGQTVSRIEDNVLTFARRVDLVMQGPHMVVLVDGVVSRLFADVEIVAAAVPALVAQLQALPNLAISGETCEALTAACAKRRLMARRLFALLGQPHMQSLTVDKIETYLTDTRQDVSQFITDGELCVEETHIEALVEVLGQQRYRGGYDDELRRAERSSTVQ